MSENWIRASEIGDYLYCKHSWFLKNRLGMASANVEALQAGSDHHRRHAHWVSRARLARKLTAIMLLMAFVVFLYWVLG